MNRLPKFCSARKIRLLLEMLEKRLIGARLLVLAYAVFSGGTCLKMLNARKAKRYARMLAKTIRYGL